jgi:hypothetical protein
MSLSGYLWLLFVFVCALALWIVLDYLQGGPDE